ERAETIGDLVRAVGQVESMIRTATAWRTELLELARRAVTLAPGAMLAPELAPDTWVGDDAVELAQRALVAEVATTLTVHERTAARLLDEAEQVVTGLPSTLSGMRAGEVSYRHAQAVVEHTAGLGAGDRSRVEGEVLPVAASMPAGAFERHVGRVRERLLAEPVTVRQERAAARRRVWVDPARDGMAFLTAYLPATTACAVVDRLDRAVGVLGGDDERTTDQLRADVLSALLLDDGSLDLVALSLQTAAVPQPQPSHAGSTMPGSTSRTVGSEAGDSEPVWDAETKARALETLDRLRHDPPEPPDSARRVEATREAMARIARSIAPRVTVTVPVLALLRTLTRNSDGPADDDPDDS
ncbi:DUF222 domain-containing protein, partial [Luteimicrobium sp. DT211]|uniref:DUF222 domain-containing protein n=1 Tax=Luteimicrobium sp. DT211 TaxID=3393412 RepID=UPI003CE92F5C